MGDIYLLTGSANAQGVKVFLDFHGPFLIYLGVLTIGGYSSLVLYIV